MRCAVIEFNFYHDQILPAHVLLLNRLGVRPDVYMPIRAMRNDPFIFARQLEYKRMRIDGWRRVRGTPSRLARYDVIVANSVEPLSVLDRFEEIGVPTVAVVHNGHLLSEPDYIRYFDGRNRVPLVLAEHVASSLVQCKAIEWIAPVYLGEPKPAGRVDRRRRFCVPGNIAFDRRNYAALLDAVAAISTERSDFVVACLGRAHPDGSTFRAEVSSLGLDRLFDFSNVDFSEGELPYERFFSQAAGADFILPLVDLDADDYAVYFRTKTTSSILMALALGVVPIVHAGFARLYHLEPAAAIVYTDDQLANAMRQALEETPETHRLRREALITRREALLAESAHNMARAVAAAGVLE